MVQVRKVIAGPTCLAMCFVFFVANTIAQTFTSGSTGADGALSLTTPGTIIFDPVALGLNPAVPNVFNFTTINIGPNVTVKLTSKKLTGPIYWLAQGAVTIAGTLDLSGENGRPLTNDTSDRVPAAGGAGGFSGGVGGGAALLPTQGNGPGGGTADSNQSGGVFTGSQYLIPLIGGSGGGGGRNHCLSGPIYGGGGGGGGGAILIASSISIALTTSTTTAITAAGGNYTAGCGPAGGGGSGGAVRLVASAIALPNVANSIDARGGGTGAGDGEVRLESFTLSRASPSNDVGGRLITSTPFMVVVPTTGPSTLKVTSLVVSGANIPINANPFSFPDATITAPGPVTVNIQAQYIPVGTIPKVVVMSETGPDQLVNCSALQGTLQQSTCSATITFPTGGSRGLVKATWVD